MIRQVGGPGNYIAMVVDSRTLGILSSCCSVYDVLNDGVTSKRKRAFGWIHANTKNSSCPTSSASTSQLIMSKNTLTTS